MTSKLIIAFIILSALGGMGSWLVGTIQENTRLAGDNETLVAANEAASRETNFMLNDLRALNAQIREREEAMAALRAKRKSVEGKLNEANKQLSEIELACLKSDMPESHRNILRQRTAVASDDNARENMPGFFGNATHNLQ